MQVNASPKNCRYHLIHVAHCVCLCMYSCTCTSTKNGERRVPYRWRNNCTQARQRGHYQLEESSAGKLQQQVGNYHQLQDQCLALAVVKYLCTQSPCHSLNPYLSELLQKYQNPASKIKPRLQICTCRLTDMQWEKAGAVLITRTKEATVEGAFT